MDHALAEYAAELTLSELESAHPGVELASARVRRAQRRALLAGGMSAGAYASVVMAGLATGGLATLAALPAAAATFAADLYACTLIQLQLGWDLSVITGHSYDLANPDDRADLLAVSFGLHTDRRYRDYALGYLPEMSRLGTRAGTTLTRVLGPRMFPVVGRYLVRQGLAKFAMPGIGVPLCAAVNHYTTGAAGRAALAILEERRTGRELVGTEARETVPTALIAGLVVIIRADGRTSRAEVGALEALAGSVVEADERQQAIDTIRGAMQAPEEELLDLVRRAPAAIRGAVYDAAAQAMELDGAEASEQAALERLARAAGVAR